MQHLYEEIQNLIRSTGSPSCPYAGEEFRMQQMLVEIFAEKQSHQAYRGLRYIVQVERMPEKIQISWRTGGTSTHALRRETVQVRQVFRKV